MIAPPCLRCKQSRETVASFSALAFEELPSLRLTRRRDGVDRRAMREAEVI